MPLTAAVHIDVNEHDRAGKVSPAHDDLLASIDWAPPFISTFEFGDHYTVTVRFNR